MNETPTTVRPPSSKRRLLRTLLLAMVLILAVGGVFVAMQPADFAITRSATISASASQIFPLVNDLHAWERWSPWAELDPQMTTTYSGADAGEGAHYQWSGNNDVGEGEMTIVNSVPDQRVEIELRFIRPMQAVNQTQIDFQPLADGQTEVVWSMRGTNGFMGKLFGLLMNVEQMVGNDFEKGLKNLAELVEVTPTTTTN